MSTGRCLSFFRGLEGFPDFLPKSERPSPAWGFKKYLEALGFCLIFPVLVRTTPSGVDPGVAPGDVLVDLGVVEAEVLTEDGVVGVDEMED